MVRFLNGVFGFAVVVLFIAVQAQTPAPIWEVQPSERWRVAQLEAAIEADRSDPERAAELADEYLHQREPELAASLLRGLDLDAQRDPIVQHRLALAYADMGRLSDAIASARTASARCMHAIEDAEAVPGLRASCNETTLTRIELHRTALERLEAWGVVDPQQDPEKTELAYGLSYRMARLAISQR
jgi:hypothetical protein